MRMAAGARLVLLAAALLGSAGADRSHTIQRGDTLWSLARASGVSVAQLQAMNGGPGFKLRAGEVMRLPDGKGGAVSAAPPALPPRAAPSTAARVFQRGQAVYYGGRRDARTAMTAAHLSLPFGTWVRVTHQRTGRSVVVLINDRGPFGVPSRVIDLSTAAARQLGILGEGVAPVTLSLMR